jgi:glutamate-1-semialdehyde 2,1-aminomutase
VTSYASVWTMLFQKPGRYHWMLQYYLRDEGINLSWVGTGRLNFSLDFTPKEFDETLAALLRSCRRMAADGWWADQRASSLQIQGQFLRQVAERKVRCVLGL